MYFWIHIEFTKIFGSIWTKIFLFIYSWNVILTLLWQNKTFIHTLDYWKKSFIHNEDECFPMFDSMFTYTTFIYG
jgi:hypothetical protein